MKIKREIKEIFSKPITVSIDDMDKFERKEMKKIRPIKNTWYDWLISYIPDPMRKSVDAFKYKTFSVFKKNTPKQTAYGRRKKPRKATTGSIRNLFILTKKETKDKIIRDINTLKRKKKIIIKLKE